MLLFRSEEDIDAWCASAGEPNGATLPIQQVWTLSKVWYGDRLSPDFRGRSLDDVRTIFAQFGLTGLFWSMDNP